MKGFCYGVLFLLVTAAVSGQTPGQDKKKKPKWWKAKKYRTAQGVDFLSHKSALVIQHINAVRHRPYRYAKTILKPTEKYFLKREYRRPGHTRATKEGWEAMRDAIRFLRMKGKEKGRARPLKPDRMLTEIAGIIAKRLVADEKVTLQQIRTGTSAGDVFALIDKYGKLELPATLNIVVEAESPVEVVRTILADDADPERRRRLSIMHKKKKFIGVAQSNHKLWGTVTVMIVARRFIKK